MGEQKKKCLIIGSVPMENDHSLEELDLRDCFVICADGGYDNALKLGVVPNLLIGDFDSIKHELPTDVEMIRLKVEKDDTDMMAAVREGYHRGFRDFILTGALGGERFDHSYANYCVLQCLNRMNCSAVIADGKRRVFFLNGGKLTVNSMQGATVSVFPFGCSSCTVSYTGMQYPLSRAVLYSYSPLGVSNRIVSREASVIVHSGGALVMVLP